MHRTGLDRFDMRGEVGVERVPGLAAPAAVVLACAATASQRARLSEALRPRARVRFAAHFADVMYSLRATVEHVDAVVLAARDVTGADAVPTVRAIVEERPRTAIVAYCEAGAQFSTDIRALAAAGVHQFVFMGIDDAGVAFRAVFDAARRYCAADLVMQRLSAIVPDELSPLVEAALAQPNVVVSVPALANALGVHRKTLFNRCERLSFIAPAELLAWVRLALVGYLLDSTGCTIETIALELSYPSDTALRNTIKRYLGRRATEIREHGALTYVANALQSRLNSGMRSRLPGLHLV